MANNRATTAPNPHGLMKFLDNPGSMGGSQGGMFSGGGDCGGGGAGDSGA